MSALDVLASRRKVIESDITRRKLRLQADEADLIRSQEALDSIIDAQKVLSDAGFKREWSDSDLHRMKFSDAPPLDNQNPKG
ncbi:hypothetical protein SEA_PAULODIABOLI_301 [Microbacterium phage PauloDiaboli]|nr:hypothetical protein SEA_PAULODIABOLI_301 [Microbacterium phage PauloDiaboli]